MAARPKTFDEYLAGVDADKRSALEKVRKLIHAAAPEAEEYIGYGLAAFRLHGKPLVALGASAEHCAFYPMSSQTVADHKELLKGYQTSKGTIRFSASKPLPAALVRTLVMARIAENVVKAPLSKSSKPAVKQSAATKKPTNAARTDPEVVSFLKGLEHPLKNDIEVVRKLILGASSTIREGIKWNAPSYRTIEYFATFHLRAQDRIQLVFHRGAKPRADLPKDIQITDPAGLIKWLAKDRALVTVGVGKEIIANKSALQTLVREWIRYL